MGLTDKLRKQTLNILLIDSCFSHLVKPRVYTIYIRCLIFLKEYFMQKLGKIRSLLSILLLTITTPFASADDNISSTLNNKSKQNGSEGFYLVQDKAWSEEGCILDKGKSQINPGESSVLKIKQGCTWAAVRYKITDVTNSKDMGFLGHSFRDGNFAIDISAPCNGNECNFYDLNPEQNRKN